jgi:hypothetical protein
MTFRNPGLFFGHAVSQSSPVEFRPLLIGTTLTAAVLGPEQNCGDMRSILFVQAGISNPIAIASFVSGVCENAILNLAFEEGSNVVFTVRGPGVIHISGRHFFDGEATHSRDPLQEEEDNKENGIEQDEDNEEEEEQEEEEQEDEEQEEVEAVASVVPDTGNEGKEKSSSSDDDEGEPGKKRRRRAKGNESDLEVKTIRIKGENLQYIDLCKVALVFFPPFCLCSDVVSSGWRQAGAQRNEDSNSLHRTIC